MGSIVSSASSSHNDFVQSLPPKWLLGSRHGRHNRSTWCAQTKTLHLLIVLFFLALRRACDAWPSVVHMVHVSVYHVSVPKALTFFQQEWICGWSNCDVSNQHGLSSSWP